MNLAKRLEAIEVLAAKRCGSAIPKLPRAQSQIEALARCGLTEALDAAEAALSAHPDLIIVGGDETDAEALARYGLSEFPKGGHVFRWPDSTRWAFAAIRAGAPLDEVRAGKWSKGPYK